MTYFDYFQWEIHEIAQNKRNLFVFLRFPREIHLNKFIFNKELAEFESFDEESLII